MTVWYIITAQIFLTKIKIHVPKHFPDTCTGKKKSVLPHFSLDPITPAIAAVMCRRITHKEHFAVSLTNFCQLISYSRVCSNLSSYDILNSHGKSLENFICWNVPLISGTTLIWLGIRYSGIWCLLVSKVKMG